MKLKFGNILFYGWMTVLAFLLISFSYSTITVARNWSKSKIPYVVTDEMDFSKAGNYEIPISIPIVTETQAFAVFLSGQNNDPVKPYGELVIADKTGKVIVQSELYYCKSASCMYNGSKVPCHYFNFVSGLERGDCILHLKIYGLQGMGKGTLTVLPVSEFGGVFLAVSIFISLGILLVFLLSVVVKILLARNRKNALPKK